MAGWENVARYGGVSISISGIVVVFAVLTMISVFIALLPRILELVPETDSHSEGPSGAVDRTDASQDAALAAAIGYALYLDATTGRESS